MYLENVVVDAADPRTLGRLWEQTLGTQMLTDEPDGYETRLSVPGGPVLDLCFQRVPAAPDGPQRLHLDIRGGDQQRAVVDRLAGLGARRLDLDLGPAGVAGVVLADPEGNRCCVLDDAGEGAETGPLAALRLEVAHPGPDEEFWAWLTGWVPVEQSSRPSLRHPSGRGPLLQLCPEASPRTAERTAERTAGKAAGKNRMHLDLRLEAGDDVEAVAAGVLDRGGRELHPDWGDLPWRLFTDPSGNEFCVLPAPG